MWLRAFPVSAVLSFQSLSCLTLTLTLFLHQSLRHRKPQNPCTQERWSLVANFQCSCIFLKHSLASSSCGLAFNQLLGIIHFLSEERRKEQCDPFRYLLILQRLWEVNTDPSFCAHCGLSWKSWDHLVFTGELGEFNLSDLYLFSRSNLFLTHLVY